MLKKFRLMVSQNDGEYYGEVLLKGNKLSLKYFNCVQIDDNEITFKDEYISKIYDEHGNDLYKSLERNMIISTIGKGFAMYGVNGFYEMQKEKNWTNEMSVLNGLDDEDFEEYCNEYFKRLTI